MHTRACGEPARGARIARVRDFVRFSFDDNSQHRLIHGLTPILGAGPFFVSGGWLFQIPSCEPDAFVAGDTLQWSKSLADFSSSDGWALSYRFVGEQATIDAANIAAVPNAAGGWDVSITAANSITPPGVYRLIGFVTLAGERHTVVDKAIEAFPNLATGTAGSLQTPNEIILAAIDARMLGRLTADQEHVQINGTALTRIPIEKLAALRGVYASKVWRERHPGVSYPSHAMRFSRAR